jgi:hypothetical protein
MPTGDLASRLDQALDFAAAADPYGQALQEVKRIAKAIQDKLNDGLPGDPIRVEVEAGFRASLGPRPLRRTPRAVPDI